MATSDYVGVSEAATILDLSERTLRRRIENGELPAVKLGPYARSPVRIRRDELNAYASAHALEPKETA
jgi:excisionase family DNA binding protein